MRTLRVILPILAICIVAFSGCKENPEDEPKVEVTGVTLNKTELSLAPGDTEQLIAAIEPEDADNKEVTWISATPAIATVDENGLVTAIELGWTYIDVVTQDGKHKAFCSVRVDYKQHVTGVTLNRTELSLTPGDTEQLIATVEPEDADNKEVRWESDNPAVATVDETGLVTGIKDGQAVITVTTTDGNHTASCYVSVDYRMKWVGDWDFIVERKWSIGMDEGHDTIYYLGKISIVSTDSLLIKYTNSTNVTMHVDGAGKLSKYYYMYNYARGQFEGNNEIYLETGYHGLPGGSDNIIIGTKEEGEKK